MDSTRVLIGKRIREIRKSQDLSQADLAGKLGCEPPQVSRYETGTTLPTIDQLIKIALVLNVLPGDLIPMPQQPDVIRAEYYREVLKNKIVSIESPDNLEKVILFIESL